MGFKRKQDKSFQLGGLIFDSEENYRKLKLNDFNFFDIVKKSSDDIENIFKNIETLNVTETYPDAYDEIYGLFPNATSFLPYEGDPSCEEYKISVKFFKNIKVKHFIDY